MDVGDWLRRLGLGQYEAAVHENAIDGKVLAKLTAEDLKDLGVAIVGHRRTICRRSRRSPLRPMCRPRPRRAPCRRRKRHRGKRRGKAAPSAVTSRSCSAIWSGRPALGEPLDAEDWRDLVGGYLDAASEAVAQMGGQVAKKLGDGIMALFGHPIAQENDAERAVRAALVDPARARKTQPPNAGVRTPGARRPHRNCGRARWWWIPPARFSATRPRSRRGCRRGRAGNGADHGRGCSVRSQACSSPRIAARTRSKAWPSLTALYRIVRASGAGRRSGQRALTPLVGRDEEVTMLLRRWERARAGEGQFVRSSASRDSASRA